MPRLIPATIAAIACLLVEPAPAATDGELEIVVVDKDTGEPIAARMHLKNRRGRPVIPRGTVGWKDHFVIDGKRILKLPPGMYTFELERGPEYKIWYGNFEMKRTAKDTQVIEMTRYVDMKSEGWWSGELHVHRPLKDVELLMRAEDLHVAPVITWWNDKNLWQDMTPPDERLKQFDGNRFYHVMGGEDEREGGALLYFNLDEPLPITGASREFPSPVKFLELAKKNPGVHVDIEKPFWWDTPVWVATGLVDSIGLANNHLYRDGVYPKDEAWGKPRDKKFFPGAHGNGRWSQAIYHHLLNCGLRLPPSAGSASGVLPNPVGYNRIYVHCGDELTYDKWFEGLRQGRVIVTNGPLLRPRVNGQLPGHVFTAAAGESIELDIALDFSIREKLEYLEVIKNGQSELEVRLSDFVDKRGKLPKVVFQESGWLIVRAVTNNQKTYRFASTGPYYVEIGQQPRISKKSAQFFLDWVHERARRVKLDNEEQRAEVIKHHRAARDFWQDLADRANVE